MAKTKARGGYGTLLKLGDGGDPTETFTTVAEVRNVQGPGKTLETDDATHMESPDGYREIIGTLKSGGTVSFEVNFDPTTATGYPALDAQLEAKTLSNYQLVLPSATGKRIAFSALVTELTPATPMDGAMRANCTLSVSGKPVLEDVS